MPSSICFSLVSAVCEEPLLAESGGSGEHGRLLVWKTGGHIDLLARPGANIHFSLWRYRPTRLELSRQRR